MGTRVVAGWRRRSTSEQIAFLLDFGAIVSDTLVNPPVPPS